MQLTFILSFLERNLVVRLGAHVEKDEELIAEAVDLTSGELTTTLGFQPNCEEVEEVEARWRGGLIR